MPIYDIKFYQNLYQHIPSQLFLEKVDFDC